MEQFLPNLDRDAFLSLMTAGDDGASLPPEYHSIKKVVSCATPADWARVASRGRWRIAPHLALINRYLLDLAARKITRLIVTLPPRHGKSQFISQFFSSWWLGTFPDQRVVIASYGSDLAAKFSAQSRMALAEFGPEVFGVAVNDRRRAGDDWSIANNPIGSCRSVGIGSGLSGYGMELGILDDAVKDAQAAHSPTVSEGTWEWFNSTFYTRLEPGGCIIIILTRWKEDDVAGRLIQDMDHGGERYVIVNLPAIAEEDEPPFPVGLGRKRGQALWPQRYDLKSLARIRHQITDKWWQALFQQRPSAVEGDTFPRKSWKIVNSFPRNLRLVRFWDLAATDSRIKRDPDWTAGVLMGTDGDDYYVLDTKMIRRGPAEVEDLITQTAQIDGKSTRIIIEQEPGASSPILIHNFVKKLAGWAVSGQKPDGSKMERADAWAAQQQHGHAYLWHYASNPDHNENRTIWIHDFIEQHAMFPSGTHDDIVDAASGAFGQLTMTRTGIGVTSKPTGAHIGYVPR